MTESFIRSPLFAEHGLTALFTTRLGGISPAPFDSFNFGSELGDSDANIATNLERLRRQARLAKAPHQAKQVHGTTLLWCHAEEHVHNREADALLSEAPGTAVAVRTADCLPILLADPRRGIVAAVHAGWRGTAARIAAITTEAMLAHGSKADDLIASLGPCIGPCCFTIDTQTAAQLAACSAQTASHVHCESASCRADLAAINRDQLIQNGIADSRIESLARCTSCHPELFFSHRRDHGQTGRHLAVVALPGRI